MSIRVLLADDHRITIDDLPREVLHPSGNSSPPVVLGSDPMKLSTLERGHIVQVLKQQKGNKARAARVLGIHRRKLYRLIERYGIAADGE